MKWTADQQKIIDARDCNLLVSAAAGSGKTAVLVERMLQMICDKEEPVDIDELLVVTFTKAAASQMKEKIRNAIQKLLDKEPANKHLQKQLYLLNQANILTIDSFCYKVVKEHFSVLGIDPNIRVGETGEIALLKGEIMEEVIEEFYAKNPSFSAFSECFCGDKNDEKLEEYISKVYEVSSSYPRPFSWTEDARCELFVSDEKSFLEIAYVKAYLEEIRMIAEDIKQKIIELLSVARGTDGPLYMEKALLSDIGYVEDIIGAKTYTDFHNLSEYGFANIGRGKAGTYDVELAEFIKDKRNNYKDEIKKLLKTFELPFEKMAEQIEEQREILTSLLDITDEFRKRFLEAKLERNILEFSDVEHFALQALCDGYDEEKKPIPSTLGKEMAEGFYEIMIDEYQDSNFLQEAILTCVSTMCKGRNNIFMVGDVKQSIYRFRMARPDLFMSKYDAYAEDEHAKERKLLLKNNFRSRENVLNGVNYIFYQIMGRDLGGIAYGREEALVPAKTFPEVMDNHVELMIGESKDFDFLTVKKDETLDEELEDVGKYELEATMLANRICELVGRAQLPAYAIYDEKTGEMRQVQYGDIVILLRSPAGCSDVFREVLEEYGIPVDVQNENGYLDTVEVHQILSLFRTLDNQHNELELVATMRGYFGGFTEEELAKLFVLKRTVEEQKKMEVCLYDILSCMDDFAMFWTKDENLCKKCMEFSEFINDLEEKQFYLSLSQLLEFIYYETGYYYFVEAMEEGKNRIRNMDLFFDEILRFESESGAGIFGFLCYIDRILEQKILLGGDPSDSSDENKVLIMSIHKSKGLEFPIVFLSGMGKKYNLTDAKSPLIVHPDYHIAAKYVHSQKRYGNDTFARKCFGALMRTESIAEELRILYVALTRAKEKLIMTGVTSDAPKLIHQFDDVAKTKKTELGFSVIHATNSYLELVVASFMRNQIFFDAVKQIPKRFDKKGETVISAEYECPSFLDIQGFDLKVTFLDFKKIVVTHILRGSEKDALRKNHLLKLAETEGTRLLELRNNLSWEYDDLLYARQKSKLSVTEIKRMYEHDFNPDEMIAGIRKTDKQHTARIPNFLQMEKSISASERGTLVHKAMELLDFVAICDEEDVKKWMSELDEREILDYKVADNLTVDNIMNLLASDLGKRMKTAACNNKLYKEKRFVIGVPVSRIYGAKNSNSNQTTDMDADALYATDMDKGALYATGMDTDDRKIVVQGIIDAYFEEDDGIILLDYKTDRIKPEQELELVKRYETQLRLYKDTLEQLLGKPVTETYIYSFALGKQIRMF